MSKIAAEFEGLLTALGMGQSPADFMRENERKAGHRVVIPGGEPWLAAADWEPSIVVSVDGKVVRLIAILARHPGSGAFRRLIAAIGAAGLKPCIIEPTREMRATLTRWGWKGRRHGYGFESEERWKPRQNGACR